MLARVFRANKDPLSPRKATLGRIVDSTGKTLDEALVTFFPGGNSFTGEDTAEISCHGGIFLQNLILRTVIASGARPAQPGEFSRRAVMNGRLSLCKAEAIGEIIAAQNEYSLFAGMNLLSGNDRMSALKQRITALCARYAAMIDYPDEYDDHPADMLTEIGDIKTELSHAVENYDNGKILRNGIRTAIIGKPNVGKSTIMNLLCREDRSIVTDIPGTTRDIIEERVNIGGLTLLISDGAGIRKSGDPVEAIGIERIEKRSEISDLIIAVFDNSREFDSTEDTRVLSLAKGKRSLFVINKDDLPGRLDADLIGGGDVVRISAKQERSFDQLSEAIKRMFAPENGKDQDSGNAGVIINERQRGCLTNALRAMEWITADCGADIAGRFLEDALAELISLTGESASESVLDNVFEKFCVGK